MQRKKTDGVSTPATDKTPNDPVIPTFRWKVLTEGGFHGTLGGKSRIYKPGEVFEATELEVPQAFRDVIVKVDAIPVEEKRKPIPGAEATYSKQPNGELWDVVNHKGKAINGKPISEEEADALLKNLME